MTQEEELIQFREENRVQREQVPVQQEQLGQRDALIERLLARVQTLEERLNKNSYNSQRASKKSLAVSAPRLSPRRLPAFVATCPP